MAAQALLRSNPKPTEEDIRQDAVEQSVHVHGLHADRRGGEGGGSSPAIMHIGRSLRSKEAPRHVTGRGRFVDDFTLPRMLHACILRSPYAHARILSVQGQAASERPGVKGVLTPDDVKELSRPFKPGRYASGLRVPIPEYAGAVGKVRYVGEPVAMVAADTRARAEDALEAIEVDYEALAAASTIAAAADPAAAPIYEELGSNVAWEGHVSYGDIEGAFARADRVVARTSGDPPIQLDAARAVRVCCPSHA